MISSMFVRGRRLFTATSIATIVLSLLHIFGTSQPVPPSIDPIAQAMQNTSIDMGFGMAPSMWDMHQAITYTMGITIAMLGALGLIFAATTDISHKVLTRTAAVFTTGFILLAALFYVYRLPALVMIFVLLALLWGVAQRTTRLA
jgi:hypothetical protein